MEIEKISTKGEEDRFKLHINNEKNKRIIFSGKFGMGKTFFINCFFDRFKNEYHKIYLSPVNYSVSSNGDIFEYIKYDILSQLLQLEDIENYLPKETESQKILSLSLSNAKDVLLPFIKCIPSIGGTISDIIDGLTKLQDTINKNSKDKKITSFLNTIQDEKGSIYDQNCITEIISFIIGELNKQGKKTVLIIDDLDRMDPEHIFRILNIFAVHFNDKEDDNNKFNINKVMIVCDIENIKNIFIHRYGKNVDFYGYINKFFSIDIFYYKFNATLVDNIGLFLDKISYKNMPLAKSDNIELYKYILCELLENDVLTIRQLETCTRNNFIPKRWNKISNHTIYHIYNILISLYTDYSDIKKSILICKTKNLLVDTTHANSYILFCIIEYLANYGEKNQDITKKSRYEFTFIDKENKFKIETKPHFQIEIFNESNITAGDYLECYKFPFWDYLLKAFETIQTDNFQ